MLSSVTSHGDGNTHAHSSQSCEQESLYSSSNARNVEEFGSLSAKSRSLKPSEWCISKMDTDAHVTTLSSHVPCNFSAGNNRSLTMYLSLHLQCFQLFLSPDCLTQRLPIMPNFLLVANISHVKIALNRISFFRSVPQG